MRTRLRSVVAPPAAAAGGAAAALATAAGIGERLVRGAIWYRGRCNWIAVDAAAGRPVCAALSPSLGDGTAGVALFLAQLHACTGDGEARRTAIGAIAQAVAHADQATDRGLYAGPLGIAYAAARCGALLGEERLAQRAARLARRAGDPAPERFDVVAGAAGAIVALLALSRLLADDRLAGRAARLGDVLVAAARPAARAGASWPVPGEPRAHGLCGFAHGASGAAWALLELFALTADERHRAAAERALDYEREWFDAGEGNWPDLRGIERRERRGSFRAPYENTWRHGAPGIALARLRALELLGDERHRAEAATAFASTSAHVERALDLHGADFTLAAGIAGSADVLLQGGALAPAGAALAQRAGDIGAGRYGAHLDGWPCGVAGDLAPGLLRGHAGIGLLYMRLHDRSVPSPLFIRGTT